MANVFGEAGYGVRGLARRRREIMALCTVTFVTLVVVALLQHRFWGALFFCGGGFFVLRHWLVRVSHANIGARAEDETAGALDRLPDTFTAVNDVAFRRFNVDHVVVGPTGVWAIETKSHRGPVTENQEGVYVAGHFCRRDPRRQARGGAKAISDLLRERIGRRYWVEALVCFPYAEAFSNQHADNVRVVGTENLCHRIQSAPERLGPDECRHIVNALCCGGEVRMSGAASKARLPAASWGGGRHSTRNRRLC